MTTATPIPTTCDGCRDAVPAWLVRMRDDVQLVCDDCYTAYYQNSNRTDAWEADPIPPDAPPQPTALVDRLIDQLFSDGVLDWQAASHYRAIFNPHK